MKKQVTIVLASFLFCFAVKAQHIPDNNFADAIRKDCSECIDSSNNLLPPAKDLKKFYPSHAGISSIEGIQGFTSLESLDISHNNVSSLPFLPESIKIFGCKSNNLDKLPILPRNLTELDCRDNKNITALPPLPASLKALWISGTSLKKFPVLPSGLETLGYASCPFPLPALPASLTYLNCEKSTISFLPALPAKLHDLDCSNTKITFLPKLPASLYKLYCSNTMITSLPTLPAGLDFLDIYNTKITALPFLPDALEYLKISDDVFDCIPSNNPKLWIRNNEGNRVKAGLCNTDLVKQFEEAEKKKIEDKKIEQEKKVIDPNQKKHYIYVVYSSYQNGHHNEVTGEWFYDMDIYIYPITASGIYSFAQVKEKLSYLEERNKHGGDRYDTHEEGEWLEGKFDTNSAYNKRDPAVKNVYVKKEIILEYREE